MIVGATQGLELLFLFVVLPFGVAAGTIWFVSWRSRSEPPPVRTSAILAEGEPAKGEILSVKSLGGFLDTRPMVRVGLRVMPAGDAPAFEIEVTQSILRRALRDVQPGVVVDVRLTPDHAGAAIVVKAPDA